MNPSIEDVVTSYKKEISEDLLSISLNKFENSNKDIEIDLNICVGFIFLNYKPNIITYLFDFFKKPNESFLEIDESDRNSVSSLGSISSRSSSIILENNNEKQKELKENKVKAHFFLF